VVRTAVGLVAGTPYTRTEAQKAAILFLLKDLKKDYPNAKVVGHRDFPNVKKECPCLDVASDPDYRQLNLD
jgi:N-acetylmuramoyl-L-alanine amidase